MVKFAEDTKVPVERSRAEIEQLLVRYGADQFASGWGPESAKIMFRAKGRHIRFTLPLPKVSSRPMTTEDNCWQLNHTRLLDMVRAGAKIPGVEFIELPGNRVNG